MSEAQTPEAKTQLSQLLDGAKQTDTVLMPEADHRQAEINPAVATFRAVRLSQLNKLTLAEILTSRHEGHQY